MRVVPFLLLLSFAGYVSTQYAFQTGKQYTYQVQGRLMTGHSQIDTQYAGLELKYRVVLTVVGPNTIVLKPDGFKAVEVNAELDGGWRDGELKNESPAEIQPELRAFLESPMELTMDRGTIQSIKVQANLPTWAVNIKKAQASHFVLDTTGANAVLNGNLNRKTNSVRPEEANEESGFFYETMEDTVHGECETYYTVSQNGPFNAPYPYQQQAQPGQQDENSQENSAQQNSQEDQQNGSQEQQQRQKYYKTNKWNYQNTNQYQNDEQEQDNSFEGKQQEYYQKQGQDQDQQYNYNYNNNYNYQQEYSPYNAYHQYAAYKQYAQQEDSASAEDSRETRQGELPWPKAFDTFCDSQDQIYEIVKSVNFTACKNKPVLAHSTAAGLYGRAGDNAMGSALERAVITRFLACGKDRKQYTILQIKQEEQVNYGLSLNQKIIAGTVQNVTLVSITKASTPIRVQNSKVIQELSYTFDPQEQKLQKAGKIPHAYEDVLEDNDEEQNNQPRSRQEVDEDEDEEEQQQNQQQQAYNYNYNYQMSQSQKSKSRRPRSASAQQDSSEESSEEQGSYETHAYQTEAEGRGTLPQPSLTAAPLNPLLVSPLQTSGMKKRIQDLMQEIVEDITTDKQSMAQAETLSKISTLPKILRFLGIKDVEELYNKLADKRQTEEDQVSRNIFLDAVAIAGTNPNIKFLTDLIEKKQLTGEHAAQIIMTFPMYVRTPTPAILKEIFELTDSSAVASDNDQVKTSAILALSTLLYQACVDSRIRESRYPVAIYGEFCDEKLVQRKYAPYFIQNLKKHLESQDNQDKHWVITYLTALGNLGTPETVQVVQEILDNEQDPYIKVNAVLALKNLIISRSAQNVPINEVRGVDRDSQDQLTDELIENQVLPILMAVAADKGEHPEVRMSAISLLFYSTPADITIWQQLAYMTWFSGSQEVNSFIYSSLESLAKLDEPISKLHYSMQQKARAVFSLAKPNHAGMAKSRNSFSSQFFEHVQSGLFHHFQYFGSKDSSMPNYVFYRNNIQYGNGAQGVNPIEVSLQGHTIQKLVDYFYEQIQKQSSVSEAHSELQQVHQILGIEAREQDEEIEGSLRFKLRSEMERLFSLNEQTIQQLIKEAKGQLLPKLLNGLPINYQKTFHMMEHSYEFPSAFGLPLNFNFRMPVHLSLRGNLKIVNEDGLKDVQLQAELHPVYAWKTHSKVSFKAPFTGKKYQAGVQRHMVVEAPFRATARRAPAGQVVLALSPSPLTSGSPSGKIDLITFHQRPYTAIVNDEFWPTSHKEGGAMTMVHATETPYKNEQQYGEEALGMSFKLQEETEYESQAEGPSGWVRFWKRFHSPTCFFNVGWLGVERVVPAQRIVTLDVSQSETKTLALIFGAKTQQNAEYQNLWDDSKSGSSQSSEESGSSESNQNQQSNESQQQQDSRQATRGSRRQQEQYNNNYAADSSEDPTQGGRVIAVALLGKRVPIRSPKEARGQIQKILQAQNPSTVQYMVQASKSQGRFYLRAASGDAANEAAVALPQTSESLRAVREAVIRPQNTKTQPDGCFEFEGEYDAPKHANRHELIVLRKVLLQEELEVKIKAEAQFGQSCRNMPHEIKAQGKLTRGPRMTEWAQTKSPQAQQCAEDEEKGFSVSPVCMEVAEHQAAALNNADIKITFSKDIPDQFVNRTYDAEDFVKAYLYPYLSHDQFHQGAGQGQIRVQAHMTPSKEFIDVTVTKPDSRISFRSVRTNRFLKALLPLTATQSLRNNIADRTLRADSDASCSVEGNQVNTFDNVTYRFNPQVSDDCYHVLAKDCSGREPVAVLVKDITAEKKEVTILLGGQTKIELLQSAQPRSGVLSKAKLQVEVNDQRQESLPRVIRAKDSGRLIASIELMNDGGIQVISPQFQVATNGKYIVVFASNSLRNRTCGVCGDFDGEKVGEMRGPKDCALSSGSLLVASYAFQSLDSRDKAQCKVQAQAKQQIAHEQAHCLTNAAYAPNQQPMFQNNRPQYNYNYQNYQNNIYQAAYYQSNQHNQQSQERPSAECVKKISTAVRSTVYDVVNSITKLFVWPQQKHRSQAAQVADQVAKEIEEILSQNRDAESIAKAVVRATNAAIRSTVSEASWVADAVSKAGSPLLEKAVLLSINPICKTSGCAKAATQEYNPNEVAQQLATALADESETDPSDLPFIPAKSLPMECLLKLETSLSKVISKLAYYILISDRNMSESERVRISGEIARVVREAVRKTMSQGGNGRLLQTVMAEVRKVFPDGIRENLLVHIVKRVVPLAINRLKMEGCKFPTYRSNNNQQQQYYQQY